MKEKQIFADALAIESSDDRAEFLNRACGDDLALRRRVDTLIEASRQPSVILDTPLFDVGHSVDGDEIDVSFLEECDKPDTLGKLGGYEVVEVLGRGATGIVLKVHDRTLNRFVAAKVLIPQIATNGTARKRFLREARATAAISHPHVITIHAVEEHQRLPYLVMECIDGKTLQDKIDQEGALEIATVLRIGFQVAEGLAAAHAQGLIHRDIKPANILLENGIERVSITDFGLARAADDATLTKSGYVSGTPQFMSPEQTQGQPLDSRSDLFSLGSVMYAMCTGHSPFRADSTIAAIRRVCDDTPRRVHEVNAEIPRWMSDIIHKMLAKDPVDRFQSAAEVAELLRQRLAKSQASPQFDLLEEIIPAAEKSEPATKSQPKRGRRTLVTVILLVGMLVLAALEGTGVTNLREQVGWADVPLTKLSEKTSPAKPSIPSKASNTTAKSDDASLAFRNIESMEHFTIIPGVVNRLDQQFKPLLALDRQGEKMLVGVRRFGEGKVAVTGHHGFYRHYPEVIDGLLHWFGAKKRSRIRTNMLIVELRKSLGDNADDFDLVPWNSGDNLKPGEILFLKLDIRYTLVNDEQIERLQKNIRSGACVVLGCPLWGWVQLKRITPLDAPKLWFNRFLRPIGAELRVDKLRWKESDQVYVLNEQSQVVKSITLRKPPTKPVNSNSATNALASLGKNSTHPTPTEILTSDEWKWTEPVNLGAKVNSEAIDTDPHLSTDGLTLLFSSARPSGRPGKEDGLSDLWMSRRAALEEPFGQPVNLGPTVNCRKTQGNPTMSADGLVLVYSAYGHRADLLMSTRSSTDEDWSRAIDMGPKFNGPEWDSHPWLSADGLTLWFNTFVPQGGTWSLRMSRRASRDAPWSEPVTLSSGVGHGDDENPRIEDVTISGDELSRVFWSNGSLYLSTRPNKASPWSKGIQFGPSLDFSQVGRGFLAWSPFLTADGRTLLFASKLPGGSGSLDLWMSRRVPVKSVPAADAPAP